MLSTVQADGEGNWTLAYDMNSVAGVHHLNVQVVGSEESFGVDINYRPASGTHNGASSLSLNDVLSGGQSELFATDHALENATLNLQDVHAAAADNATTHGMSVATPDVASVNTRLVLPQEQVHAVM